MRQRFEVPGKLPSLNDYVSACRANPYKGAKANPRVIVELEEVDEE